MINAIELIVAIVVGIPTILMIWDDIMSGRPLLPPEES